MTVLLVGNVLIVVALLLSSSPTATGFQWGGLRRKAAPGGSVNIPREPVAKVDARPVLTVRDPVHGGCIHLVGVSHGSATSANLVKDVMSTVQPAAVVLELCDDRFFSISLDSKIRPRGNATLTKAFDDRMKYLENKQRSSSSSSVKLGPLLQLESTVKFISSQGVVGGVFVLLGLFVSNLQRLTRSETGGDEFVTAMMEAERLNIPVRLGDAPQNDTLRSIRGVLSKETFEPAKVAQGALFLAFSAFGVAAEKSNQRLAQSIPAPLLRASQWLSIPETYTKNTSMLQSLMPLFLTLLLTTTLTYFPFGSLWGVDGGANAVADVGAAAAAAAGSSNGGGGMNAARWLLAAVTSDPPPEVEAALSTVMDALSILLLIRMAKVRFTLTFAPARV
jgi:hypothetical protein